MLEKIIYYVTIEKNKHKARKKKIQKTIIVTNAGYFLPCLFIHDQEKEHTQALSLYLCSKGPSIQFGTSKTSLYLYIPFHKYQQIQVKESFQL